MSYRRRIYFTNEHKAFAINPNNKENFWWAFEWKNDEDVIKYVMKRCGSECKLFAVNNKVDWNGQSFTVQVK